MNTPRPAPLPPDLLLVRLARILYERGLTELCGGNASLRRDGDIYITPTCAGQYFYWQLAPTDIMVVAPDGTRKRGRPEHCSRETALHLEIYRQLPKIGSFLHLHTAELLALGERRQPLTTALRIYLDNENIDLAVLDAALPAQTAAHDRRIVQLIARMQTAVRMVIGPTHGVFAAAPSSAANLKAIDSLVCRLQRIAISRALATTTNVDVAARPPDRPPPPAGCTGDTPVTEGPPATCS